MSANAKGIGPCESSSISNFCDYFPDRTLCPETVLPCNISYSLQNFSLHYVSRKTMHKWGGQYKPECFIECTVYAKTLCAVLESYFPWLMNIFM